MSGNPTAGIILTEVGSSTEFSVADLVRPGLRRNPRRAHLLVSTVLGKHIPVAPDVIVNAASTLALLVRSAVPPGPVLVLGFAETATGLGHCVAAALDAHCYLHSTRRVVPSIDALGGFEEGHSHATGHLLLPTSAALLPEALPLVLVDDEISTGATALDAIRALQLLAPRRTYVIASLVDMRSPEDHLMLAEAAEELGVDIESVSLAQGLTELAPTLIEQVTALPAPELNPIAPVRGVSSRVDISWPTDVPDGGRHGFLSSDTQRFDDAVSVVAAAIDAAAGVRPLIVVGHEEFMYLPLRVAAAVASPTREVLFQTTTRSPAYVIDDPTYPLRRGFVFTAPETVDDAPRYVYNVSGAADALIVLVVDEPADTSALFGPGGVVDVLTASGSDVLVAVVAGADPVALRSTRAVPLYGPAFGSYEAEEVTWLLKDLSALSLEADVASREKQIQDGTAHYAESLPVEYQPDSSYRDLFESVLQQSAPRLALAVATLTDLVLRERSHGAVLVSLARAGTPIGILMRRWAKFAHGLDLAHYAISIVRDRGIDANALNYIAAHHDPANVVFVDGWTGKGAIARELSEALSGIAEAGGPQFNDDLAVLADPGHCASTYGTRDDFLIASACLNSTVSGLISRTVLNSDFIGPNDFHGAKFYSELASQDVSNHLLDVVSAQFPLVSPEVCDAVDALLASDRTPTWAGWRSVEKVQAEYGISSVNFVKPGVGETTRVLLRRLPWKVLVRAANAPEHAHIRMLAASRGVPVDVVPDLAYSCMGLIRSVS